MSQIQITFDIDSAALTNCFMTSGAGVTGLTWQLSNTELNYDALSVSPLYATLLDSICASPGGLRIPYETCQSLLTNYPATAGQKSIVLSKQVKSLSHVLVIRQSQTINGGAIPSTWPKISTFEKCGFTDGAGAINNFYTQIGGARFPNDNKTAGPAYLLTLDAHHLSASPWSVVMDYENFVSGFQTSIAELDPTAQAQVLGVSYEKTRNEDVMSAGFDTGSQNIQVYLTDAPTDPVNCYGFVYFHQILHLAGNMVRVEQQL
jgi:hypothetical protein